VIKFRKETGRNQLEIPDSRLLPHDSDGEYMPFVNVGNDAFAFSEQTLRFYPNMISRIQNAYSRTGTT
jgi:hypothetical protein